MGLRFPCSLFAARDSQSIPEQRAHVIPEQGSLSPSAAGRSSDFPKLEHHFNKAEGQLTGREGGTEY